MEILQGNYNYKGLYIQYLDDNHLDIFHLTYAEFIFQCFYQVKHMKTYEDAEDETRLMIFLENRLKIAEHNRKFELGQVTYSMAMNQFGDLVKTHITCIFYFNPSINETFFKYILQNADLRKTRLLRKILILDYDPIWKITFYILDRGRIWKDSERIRDKQ